MTRLVPIVLWGAIAWLLLPDQAMAGSRARLYPKRSYARPAPSHSSDALERYPKYYGGFHSRELQNIGIPNGDIGLRGNGIELFPW